MRILAIDPGPDMSGYVIIDSTGDVLQAGKEPTAYLLRLVGNAEYDMLAIEVPRAMGMPAMNSVMDTCIVVGEYKERGASVGKGAILVPRRTVKLHLCGQSRAKDSNVIAAIKDRYGGEGAVGRKAHPGPLYGVKRDAWQALALALYVYDTMYGGTTQ